MKIKSQLYDNASGSIGNITAANGRGGLYFKNKPNPSNPNTTAQKVVRSALALANVAWLGTTQAVRDEWEAYGATCIRKNQVGSTVALTGWNAFSRVFVVFTQAGIASATLVAGAPAGQGFKAEPIITLASNDGGDKLEITNASSEADIVVVYGGKTTRSTINNYGGSYNIDNDYNLAAGASADTGVSVSAGKTWVRFQAVSADGQLSKGTVAFLEI